MRYICQVCGYIYDDAKEKVPFAELPDDWRCPLCRTAKSDFRPEEATPAISEMQKAAVNTAAETIIRETPENDPDAKKLSIGQLAALCSNLARGCEKQYKPEEAGLFRNNVDFDLMFHGN